MIEREQSKIYLSKMWIGIFSVIILHAIMPIIGRAISRIATTYFLLLLVLLIWLFFLKYERGRIIVQIFPLIAIESILLIESIGSGNGFLSETYGFLLGLTTILIGVLLADLDYSQQIYFFKVVVLAFIITLITSIIGLLSDPTAARYLTTVASSAEERFISLEWKNVGGYSFVYMLLPVYPIAICYIKKTNKPLVLRIGLFTVMLIYFINAQFATALILFFAISILWLLPRNLSAQKMILIVIIGSFVLYFLREPLGNLFARLASNSNSYILYERFNYISNSLLGIENTSDVGRREDVLRLSIQSIMQHPILGTWYMEGRHVGGHTFTLDFIAKYGIFGFVLLIMSYRCIYTIQYSRYRNEDFLGYVICSFLVAIVLSTVNTGTHWFELMLVNPLILNIIQYSDELNECALPEKIDSKKLQKTE